MSNYRCKKCGKNLWRLDPHQPINNGKPGFCKMCMLSELSRKGKKKR